MFPVVTLLVAGAVGVALLFAVPAIRRAVFPLYLEGADHELTGQKFLYDRLLGWRNIPDWESTTYGRPLTINSRGLRDREYAFAKPAGTKRILALGDSYTWGYGVGDEELYTEVLERAAARDGRAVEVLNAGVSGWGTDQEYLFFREEGIRYEPDIVVVTFFFNDLFETVRSVMYGSAKPVFRNVDLELQNVPVPKPWVDPPQFVSEAGPYELVVTIYGELARLCAPPKCRLIVMKFGNSVKPDDLQMREMEMRFESRFAQWLDLPYLDLDEIFAARGTPGRQLVTMPHGHWNAAGHRETADVLYEFLLDNAWLD